MSKEHPIRFPPPLARTQIGSDGKRHQVIEEPFMECGQQTTLRGIGDVVCVRRLGHPVRINYGHTNGYAEWSFDTP